MLRDTFQKLISHLTHQFREKASTYVNRGQLKAAANVSTTKENERVLAALGSSAGEYAAMQYLALHIFERNV